MWEDPPLFASAANPAVGQSIRQGIGAMFSLWNTYLGDQWSVGDWDGLQRAIPQTLPMSMLRGFAAMFPPLEGEQTPGVPQNLKEYDPEWGRSFWSGTVAASCDHERMLRSVTVCGLSLLVCPTVVAAKCNTGGSDTSTLVTLPVWPFER